MKVIVLSDLHGNLIDIKESFDLMIIAGDVCPVWNHNLYFQENWLVYDFANWIHNLPFKDENSKVVMCAGNHDFVLDNYSTGIIKNIELNSQTDTIKRLVYLENEMYEFQGLKIFGTPYCKKFMNWAFMYDNRKLKSLYKKIPEGLDILFSHDAADIDELGLIHMGRWEGENAGNTVLADRIKEVKPKYYFCGHIHSGRHELKDIDNTKSANVSILNENYEVVNEPFIFEI